MSDPSPPLKLISSMATRQVLAELLASHERTGGTPAALEAVGGVDAARRVQAGEAFDVVALARNALDTLMAAGCLVPGSIVDLMHSGMAVAVRAGASRPDLTDEDSVKAAVRAARSIGYSTGPSGTHLIKTFERWGLAEEIRSRLVQATPGVPVARLVAEGQVEIGFQQLSELLNVQGIDIVGPPPAGVQIITTFSAAIASTCAQPAAARALCDFLASPAAAAAKRRQGMEPA